MAIARALATKPMIVLADEPTANLDSKTGKSIIELMKKLNQELETTFIFSTHDPEIVEIARPRDPPPGRHGDRGHAPGGCSKGETAEKAGKSS